MLVLLVALWTISTILIVADPKTESTRWLAAISFFSGFGGLSTVIKSNLIPYFQANITLDMSAINKLNLLYALSASLAHYIAPYTLLIYGIIYSNCFKDSWVRRRNAVKIVLFIPPIAMYFLFPIYTLKTSYMILSIWVTPYVLIANFLLIYSYLKTKGRILKQQRLLTCIIIAPGTLMSLMTNYLLRVFEVNDAFYSNIWIIILQFIAFIFFSIKQGALGVKLTFEKTSMDRTMKALTSGTAILNHTIKNEVYKISMCMNNIEYSAVNAKKDILEIDNVHENIKIINDSTNYLSVMINKIQAQVKDIILEENTSRLDFIIDKAINMVIPFTKDKNIKVVKNHIFDLTILCDVVHLQETFINILKNAIEAIGTNGEISIEAIRKNRSFTIAIKDNGHGIPKENLSYVIDPFFSTKHRTENFGLGLSYCYSVMQQHGGSLEIGSEEGVGTTVLLSLPAKRICKEQNYGVI